MHRNLAPPPATTLLLAANDPQAIRPRSSLHGSKHPSTIDRVPDHTNWCAIAEPGRCNVNTSVGKALTWNHAFLAILASCRPMWQHHRRQVHVRTQRANQATKSTTPSSQHHTRATVSIHRYLANTPRSLFAAGQRPADQPSSPLHGSKHPSTIDRVPDHINWCAIAEPGGCKVNLSAGKPLRRSLHFR